MMQLKSKGVVINITLFTSVEVLIKSMVPIIIRRHVTCMNIHSLPKHGGELTVFLNILQSDLKVIILCEIGAKNISTVENLYVGRIYRHSNGNVNHFMEDSSNGLNQISPTSTSDITGYVNIDLKV